ncbi:MAG TPA: alpha-amylase family glycosyl hydrolase [Acidisarcina sp.]
MHSRIEAAFHAGETHPPHWTWVAVRIYRSQMQKQQGEFSTSLPMAVLGLLAMFGLATAHAQSTLKSAAARSGQAVHGRSMAAADPWWEHAVIYEIYPRSFQDSNGDGVGDLKGITSRLDYLKVLGVDAIWLTPIYPSPQVDFGYDISDYEAIDPQYGTMVDFDQLVAEAKKRNIRVIMDLVLNHTSDKHPWFLASESSKKSPKRDWYVWRDGKAPGQPPNNWTSLFGHSAWQFDAKTNQYYYHKFYVQQPDLNWYNPKVKAAMYGVARFWLAKGVAGFRLDAVNTLYEDPSLADEGVAKDGSGKPLINAFGDQVVDESRTSFQPKVHDVLKDLRKIADGYPGQRVLVGETYISSVQGLRVMYGKHDDELQLPMDTQIGLKSKLDVAWFRQRINEAETQLDGNQPLIVFDNHDNPRWDRYGEGVLGNGVYNTDIGRVLATVLFVTRGTALMYYGDEIGMKTTPPLRQEDVKDPIGKTGWPKEKGRDGERTPMQWDNTPNAGFTKGQNPWLPVPPSFRLVNEQAEVDDHSSLLNWYKQLIELRRTNSALHDGDNIMVSAEDKSADNSVLSWVRVAPDKSAVLVVCNFTDQNIKVGYEFRPQGYTKQPGATLMKTPGSRDPASLDAIELPAFGVYIGQLQPVGK